MKDFFTFDKIMIDLLIVVAIAIIAYLGTHGVSIPVSEVGSSSFFSDVFTFFTGHIPKLGFMQNFLDGMKVLFAVIAIIFFAGTIWIVLRIREAEEEEHKRTAPILPEVAEERGKSIQWQSIKEKASSGNPAEWKLAILEADSVLDELLEERGYPGDSIGERLKSMSPSDFLSYDDAWEAHKVRNQIAHEGASMDLSQKIVRETISRYEKVFKEMGSV